MPSGALSSPSISVSSSGVITATSGISTAGYLGTSASKSNTKSLSTKGATTITPSTNDQTAVSSGYYTTGAVTVKGDSNLTAGNIKKGTTIFGVTGTYNGPSYDFSTITITPQVGYGFVDYYASDEGFDGYTRVTVNKVAEGSLGETSIGIDANGKVTASTAVAYGGYLSTGDSSSDYLQLDTIGGTTYYPSTSAATIKKGRYITSDITIAACSGTANVTHTNKVTVTGYQYAQVSDSNLKAENIKSGVSILGIPGTYTGASYSFGTKTVDPLSSSRTYSASTDGYDGFSSFTVNAAPLQSKTVTPTKSSQTISAESSYYGLSSVTVNPIPDNYVPYDPAAEKTTCYASGDSNTWLYAHIDYEYYDESGGYWTSDSVSEDYPGSGVSAEGRGFYVWLADYQ